MQDNHIIWKHIFNSSKSFNRDILEAAVRARSCGYALFSWNGDLWTVSASREITRIGTFDELGL